MEIGDEKYNISSCECWMIFSEGAFYPVSLSIEIETDRVDTYWTVAPIQIKNYQELIKSDLQIDLELGVIDDLDSTLIKNDNALNIWNQKVIFKNLSIFDLNSVKVVGETDGKELVKVSSNVHFVAFEIWKTDNYQAKISELERILKRLNIEFYVQDETSNEIRLKIKN